MIALAAALLLAAPQDLPDERVVRERLESVLASPDYDSGDPGARSASLLQWILQKIAGLFRSLGGLGEISPFLFWLVLAVCVAILLLIFLHGALVVSRALRASRTRELPRDADPAGPDDPRELLERARAAARAGRRDDALRLAHRAALLGLDRRGVLRFQESLTNGDYRRQLRARPRESEAFDALIRLHEPVCFGKRPAVDAEVEQGVRLASLLLEGRVA
jgi:hypothetical protein